MSPSVSSSSNLSGIEIPSHWRPETQYCIDKKCLSAEARNDIIRTIVTLSIAKFGPRPSRADYQQQARKLILQYPFMKDDIGVGYVSYLLPLHTFIDFLFVFRPHGLKKC